MSDFEIVGYSNGVPIKRYPEGMCGPPILTRVTTVKKSKHRRAEAEKWFWNRWSKARTREDKLILLRRAANNKFKLACDMNEHRKKMRQEFEKDKRISLNGKKCAVCKGVAAARHHIFALANGGRNHKRNLLALCATCHAEVHPWLVAPMARSLEVEMKRRIEREV